MDEKFVEQANELTAAMTQAAIDRIRMTEPRPVNFDGSCDCGEIIPSPRAALGYFRCIACQTMIENRKRR